MKYDFAHPKFRNGQVTFDIKEKPLIDIFREQAIRNRLLFRDMVLYNDDKEISRIRNFGHALEVIDLVGGGKRVYLRSKGDIVLYFDNLKNDEFYNESVKILDEALEDPDTGIVFEKDNAALQKYFKIFNDKYFDGKLAPIQLRWFKGTGVHGAFCHKTNLAEKKIEPVEIKLNINASGTFAAFRNVFVHEMLHYYVDVYIGLPDQNWEHARWCALRNDRRGFHQALRATAETCHKFEWKRLADELSEKFPELGNIERYAVHNAETGIAQYDQKYIVDWAAKNIMLKQVDGAITRYYIVSNRCPDWANLQAALASGESIFTRFRGTWYRLFPTLDPKKFELYRTSRDLTRYYARISPDMIRKGKELGTVK